MDPKRPEDLSLRDYLAPLIARRWLVLAIVVLTTAAAYAISSREEKVFEASTKLYLAQEGNPLVGAGAGFSDERSVQNQATLLTSQDVARAVAEDLSFDGSPSALAARVTATPSAGTDFISIAARGRTGGEAAAIANGFARAFIDFRSADRREQIDKALSQLRKQLDGIPRGESGAAERAEIASNIRQLEVASSSAPGIANQIDPARPPGAAASPKPRQSAALALALSLLGSIFLVYLLNRLDPRLRKVEEAASIYERPVLASIVHDPDINRLEEGVPTMSDLSKETFRELRVNLDLLSPGRPYKIIVVTSAGPGEGKTSVARNLGLALHEAGRRVALIDADLRKPTLSAVMGKEASDGLTDVLSGEKSLRTVLRSVAVESRGVAALGRMAGPDGAGQDDQSPADSISLLPAGPQPPNPPAVLESEAMMNVLREVCADRDVVIIDTAPLLAVSDAIPVVARADAVLLVARSGMTDRRSARHAADLLARVPNVNLVGLVVNGITGVDASAYGTGYGYGYGDPERAKAATSGAAQG